jgi:hypothetical protein
MRQQQLEAQVKQLEEVNAQLRAEIDNLQAPRPAPTIVDIVGPEAFERMVELYPSFRESGTPTNPNDAASEVLWSCVRMLGRMDKSREAAVHRTVQSTTDYIDIYARLERATSALAEYAMRAAEGGNQ